MRFILLVEGETEGNGVADLIRRWLSEYFERNSRPGVLIKEFEGWSDLRDSAPKSVERYLTDPEFSDVIAVVSLLDLYGPLFYSPDAVSVRERYDFGCDYMLKRVEKHLRAEGLPEDLARKYRHFFAVHETEAWLLTRPDLFHKGVRKALTNLRPPEEINFDTTPGKLLEKLYLRETKRAYVKTKAARHIFPQLDAVSTADKCPYLKAMLCELRSLALAAGARPIGDWATGETERE